MGYSLDLHAVRVVPYLRKHPGLTREDRVKLFAALNEFRELADQYRSNPDRRLAPESPYFWFDFVFRCTDGQIRNFWFLIDDSSAQYGVLRVDFVDEGGQGRN